MNKNGKTRPRLEQDGLYLLPQEDFELIEHVKVTVEPQGCGSLHLPKVILDHLGLTKGSYIDIAIRRSATMPKLNISLTEVYAEAMHGHSRSKYRDFFEAFLASDYKKVQIDNYHGAMSFLHRHPEYKARIKVRGQYCRKPNQIAWAERKLEVL